MKLTVVICSHNPRKDYLLRTLDALRAQTLPCQEWELILVDNASASPLAEVWDLSWHPGGRHVVELELGVAAARVRGMKESGADLIVFVDDDNVLDRFYLAQALEIERKWPMLGVWGSGTITPEYEQELVDDLKDLEYILAIRRSTEPCCSSTFGSHEAVPWGAGMCVRAAVAKAYCRTNKDSSILIPGRRGASLLAGEDDEIAYVACELGLGMGVFPELRLAHLIPKERVSRTHLLALVEGAGASTALLQYKWNGRLPHSPFSPRGLLSILKNLILAPRLERETYFAQLRGQLLASAIIRLAINTRRSVP